MRANDSEHHVKLTLTGERAERGIPLADFESFIDAFIAALRDYDGARRGEATRKAGHPERRADAASAFRLVRVDTGSAIATLVPEQLDEPEDTPELGDLPLALTNLASLVNDVAQQREVPEDVVDALERARRACGEHGAIEVDLPEEVAPDGPVLLDRDRIARLARPPASGPAAVESVSGRLHAVNLEPDRMAIRSGDGVEWACRYEEALEPKVRSLLGEVVWARGEGRLTGPLRGSMRVEGIEPVVHGRQTELFTPERVPLDVLLERQGIGSPQGLDALEDDAWVGDDADERYLAAMTGSSAM
ncbi:MAG: hypothetical protein MSC31_19540 [Solirubrobacteraceae bacterium MAG38_C4-C5]|nr:hypothetical protein [Candidatus Siliceabacter maunaloa]